MMQESQTTLRSRNPDGEAGWRSSDTYERLS